MSREFKHSVITHSLGLITIKINFLLNMFFLKRIVMKMVISFSLIFNLRLKNGTCRFICKAITNTHTYKSVNASK
jgi:hypothetical protein